MPSTTTPCALGLLMFALLACGGEGREPRSGAETTAAADSVKPSCLPISPNVRGSLAEQRDSAQREARRVRIAERGTTQEFPNGSVTIHPTCGSHTFRVDDLARGQFVARLTINGQVDSLSRFPNDTVFWWVYLDVSSGRPEYRSEFLSLAARDDASHIERDGFVIRCRAAALRDTTERAGWEPRHDPEPCPDAPRTAATTRLETPVRTASMALGVLPLPRTMAGMRLQGGGVRAWYACPWGCCQSQDELQ